MKQVEGHASTVKVPIQLAAQRPAPSVSDCQIYPLLDRTPILMLIPYET